MTKSEIREIIHFMNSLYPNRKIDYDTGVIDIWYEMFENYSFDDVKQSIKDISLKQRYIPNIPEILDNIRETFTSSYTKIGDYIIVYVEYYNEKYPFKFINASEANVLLGILKTKPSKKRITELYTSNIKLYCP